MEDSDIKLADELRGMVAGRAPNPPDSLLDFIDTVTVTRKRTRAPIVTLGSVSLPGRVIGLAAAAVLIAAVAGTALMIGGRTPGNAITGQSSPSTTPTPVDATPALVLPTPGPSPTPEPVATQLPSDLLSEWTWKMLDNDGVQAQIAVPGGYIATCQGTTRDKATLCSSVDGAHWTDPADPKMLRVEGPVAFWPQAAVHVGNTYVAFALERPILSLGENLGSLWRSADGHAWSKLNVPALAGLKPSNVGLLAGRFSTIGEAADGKSALFASTDGLSWSKLVGAPILAQGEFIPNLGVLVDGVTAQDSGSWISKDGHTWVEAVLPGTLTTLGRPAYMSDGTYVAVGYDFIAPSDQSLLRSSDGITWTSLLVGLPGREVYLTAIGDRLILSRARGEDPFITYAAWQSSDKGASWQSLPGPDGYPVTSLVFGMEGKVTTTTSDGFIWIGTLNVK